MVDPFSCNLFAGLNYFDSLDESVCCQFGNNKVTAFND
jgi:hypothetical protein